MKRATTYKHLKTEPSSSVKLLSLSLFSLLFLLLFLSLSSAVPKKIQSDIAIGLNIESGFPSTHKVGTDYYIHTHVYNATSGSLLTSGVSCYYHFYNHNIKGGEHVDTGVLSQYGMGYSNYTSGRNINQTGEYSTLIWCNTSSVGGFTGYTFDATSNGSDTSYELITLLLMAGFLLLLIAILFENEYLGFLSGAVFIVSGIYLMIYGLGDVNDMYSRALAFVSIGFGLILEVAAGYKAAEGGNTSSE